MLQAPQLRRINQKPRTIVIKGTGFCNLACAYCYLPNKDDKTPTPVEVAQAVARSIAAMDHSDGVPVSVIWHAGEPMALGVARMAELLEPFRELAEAGAVVHGMQTNATLVSNSWINLIREHRIDVGVSIDGPEHLCTQRVDRQGRPAFKRIIGGIERLKESGIPFSVIAVVTPESIEQPTELLDFLASLGPWQIGLNIEEVEGVNLERPQVTREDAQEFWAEAINWARAQGPHGVSIREISRLGKYLAATPQEHAERRRQYEVDPIPTVNTNGDVVLLSPELADHKSAPYGDFVAGNLLQKGLASIIEGANKLTYVQEFLKSQEECQARCGFYDFCLGGQASNRYFEHGSFLPPESNFCRTTEQALVMALHGNNIHEKEKSA